MQKMYARMSADGADSMIIQTEPIIIGDIEYFGCKKVYLKTATVKDESGKEKDTQVVDDTKPVEYDSFTQLFNDAKSQTVNAATIISEMAKQKMINAQLMAQIARLGAIK